MAIRRSATEQLNLFPTLTARFPSTRYQGSKAKLVDWIWEQIADLDFVTCLDAFGGTGAVAFRLKQEGKQVTYNDLLRFNYHIGRALIENEAISLSPEELDWVLQRHPGISYPRFVQETFGDIYFTHEENAWIDQTVTNIRQLHDDYKFAIGFFALCQACIVKRPYNLFHRKNLYIRLAEVPRSFGNKATWDRPFEDWFRDFVAEANGAVFANGQGNRAVNHDALEVPGEYELVYVDTPYISSRGLAVDYLSFYHFLQGLAEYDEWAKHMDTRSKHRAFRRRHSEWTDAPRIRGAFDRLFHRFRDSIIVVLYRSDGIPSEDELASVLGRYKTHVRVEHFGPYKYVLSTNSGSNEILLVGT